MRPGQSDEKSLLLQNVDPAPLIVHTAHPATRRRRIGPLIFALGSTVALVALTAGILGADVRGRALARARNDEALAARDVDQAALKLTHLRARPSSGKHRLPAAPIRAAAEARAICVGAEPVACATHCNTSASCRELCGAACEAGAGGACAIAALKRAERNLLCVVADATPQSTTTATVDARSAPRAATSGASSSASAAETLPEASECARADALRTLGSDAPTSPGGCIVDTARLAASWTEIPWRARGNDTGVRPLAEVA